MKTLCLVLLAVSMMFFACRETPGTLLHETIYVRRAGADMPAYVYGQAREKVFVVILHGGSSFGLAFRTEAMRQELESRYAVVYWDQRGQSMAQGNGTDKAFDVRERAKDVTALMNVLLTKYGEDSRIFLLGHSWGGTLGMTYLLEENVLPQLKGWIMMDGAYDFPLIVRERYHMLKNVAAAQIQASQQTTAWQTLQQDLLAIDSLSALQSPDQLQPLVQRSLALLRESGALNDPDYSGLAQQLVVANNPIHWLVNDYYSKPFLDARDEGYGVRDRLGEIQLPTLLLWGRYDFSVPPELATIAMEEMSSADKSLMWFEHSEHLPYVTEPDGFTAAVVDFVERLR